MKCLAILNELRDSIVTGQKLYDNCAVRCLVVSTFMWIGFAWAIPFFDIPYRWLIIAIYLVCSYLNWWILHKEDHGIADEVLMPMNATCIFWVRFFSGLVFIKNFGWFMLIFGGFVFLCLIMMSIVYNIRHKTTKTLSSWWIELNAMLSTAFMITIIPIAVANLIMVLRLEFA